MLLLLLLRLLLFLPLPASASFPLRRRSGGPVLWRDPEKELVLQPHQPGLPFHAAIAVFRHTRMGGKERGGALGDTAMQERHFRRMRR